MSFIRDLLFGEPPPAPDYAGAAKEQGQQNINAAQINAAMNRIDETNPYGSVKYNSTANPDTPGGYDYSRNITLSPEQQRLYDSETGNQQASQDIATSLQKGVAGSVGTPFSLSGYGKAQTVQAPDSLGNAASYAGGAQAVGDALYQRQLALRQPGMQQDRAALDTQLKNQGLMPGTEAYDRGLQQLQQQQGQELNDLAGRAVEAQGAEQSRLAGLDMNLLNQALQSKLNTAGFNNQTRGQNIQEGLLERQQPLSEFNAFRTGNTPTIPQFQPYSMTNVAPVNSYGATRDQYGASTDTYNAQTAQTQSLLNLGSKFIPKSFLG
jgi:hypothetical protein